MNKTTVTPAISTMLQERWYSLDPVTRSEHILSNSPVYQQVLQLEATQRAFQQLLDKSDESTPNNT